MDMIKNFEGSSGVPAAKAADPAALSLTQKLKLFEKAQAEQAKAAGAPRKSSSCLKPQVPLVDQVAEKPAPGPPKPPRDPSVVNHPKPAAPPAPEPVQVVEAGPNTALAQRLLFEKSQEGWRQNEIAKKTFEEKRKDMEIVLNRWQRPVEVSVSEPRAAVATENGEAFIENPREATVLK